MKTLSKLYWILLSVGVLCFIGGIIGSYIMFVNNGVESNAVWGLALVGTAMIVLLFSLIPAKLEESRLEH